MNKTPIRAWWTGAALTMLFLTTPAYPGSSGYARGMSLTEIDDFKYDASADPSIQTAAQKTVDALYELGVRQINLTPRARMTDPRGSELTPYTPPAQRAQERQRYGRLISYIHSKGMSVGIRPIFFVVGPDGKTPYVEILPDGTSKNWWHGNIQPHDPNRWFESFKTYLDSYLLIAKANRVEEFTLGAELYSMTVGVEDQWKEYPYGFPAQWLTLLRYAKSQLSPGTRVMYDINFTDDKVAGGDLDRFGGEFERWRYRIVDLRDRSLIAFWTELDAVGIDLYRSLATADQVLPASHEALVASLQEASDRYASQIDNALFQIQNTTGVSKDLILKEVGFRSVTRGFVDPFTYAGSGELNIDHQAAAYEAMFNSFWTPGWDWFKGVVLWDTSVNPAMHGPNDIGFSPLGKAATENVLKKFYLDLGGPN